jgi:DNA-binding MarR family transcriptional regulator
MSGRERVRHLVELLDEPTPVQEIADRADVSRTTADDELQRLEGDDWVTETTVDGTKAYDVNSLDEFRKELADEEFSAEEPRERRNVIATWEAINTELGLVKHALQLYDDVIELCSPRTDSSSTLA